MIPQHGTLYLSRSRLQNNLRVLRAAAPLNAKLCPTLKANAYGHGIREVAPLLAEEGITWACVYTLEEAYAIPKFRTIVLAPLVLTGPPPLEFIARIPQDVVRHENDVCLNITDAGTARWLSAANVEAAHHPFPIHMQVDTGLTRAGVSTGDARDLARLIASLPGLELEGVFAHFSHADDAGHPSLVREMEIFLEVALPLKREFPGLVLHHQNSGGIFHARADLAAHLDLVRVGIALYGLQPAGSVAAESQNAKLKTQSGIVEGLLPIGRMTAPIIAIHERGEGTGVVWAYVCDEACVAAGDCAGGVWGWVSAVLVEQGGGAVQGEGDEAGGAGVDGSVDF